MENRCRVLQRLSELPGRRMGAAVVGGVEVFRFLDSAGFVEGVV
jgi:hypothetical protein